MLLSQVSENIRKYRLKKEMNKPIIVYRTDALAEKAVRVVGEFPATSHPEIVYPAAIVSGRNTPGASALLRYLASRDARPVWKKHGFSTPD